MSPSRVSDPSNGPLHADLEPADAAQAARREAELVARAVNGDTAAFEALYSRYERTVRAIVAAETRRSADVNDLVQDTFTLAWRRLSSLREHERFRPWLLQIARRTVIDHGRRSARRPVLDEDDDIALSLHETPDAGPEELHELHELTQRLDGALAGLSRRDATAITLAAQFGFGPSEIAAAIGTTPNTAKVVLHRARARLRAALDAT